jgi:hypothetical protein
LSLHFKLDSPNIQTEFTNQLLNVIAPAHGSQERQSQLKLRFLFIFSDNKNTLKRDGMLHIFIYSTLNVRILAMESFHCSPKLFTQKIDRPDKFSANVNSINHFSINTILFLEHFLHYK